MTIGAEFIAGWKELTSRRAAAAFSAQPPKNPTTVFMDAQLLLQCPSAIADWPGFFWALYQNAIEKYLRMPGVTTVVVAFDDHLHSPLSKGPTQVARREKTKHIVWAPHRPLPPEIPANYAQLLFNREFKGRVIEYVISRIKDSCRLVGTGSQRIIIDYQGDPYVIVGRTAPPPRQGGHGGGGAPAEATTTTTAIRSPLKRCYTMANIPLHDSPDDAPSKHKRCAVEMDGGMRAPSDAVLSAAVCALDSAMGLGPLPDSTAAAAVMQELAGGAAPDEFAVGYVIPGTVPLGESDVKFVRYLPYGDMIIHAVDSDYVLIAMCQIERLGPDCPRIFVRRMTTHPSKPVVDAVDAVTGVETKKKPVATKMSGRGFDFFPEPGQHYPTLPAAAREVHADESSPGVSLDATGGAPPAKKARREYEYVDCGAVVAALAETIGAHTSAQLKPYTIRLLAFVVALCGCDFTRGLKYVNGSVITKSTRLIWPGVCAAASIDATTGALVMDERLVAEEVVGKIWRHVQFPKLCRGLSNASGFEALFELLAGSASISQSRRDRLITPRQLGCLVRSCNWSVFYWTDPERCPCAVHGGDYGFVLEELPEGSQRKKQTVKYDDDRPLANGASVSSPQTPRAAK
jgi:hypothetical protein